MAVLSRSCNLAVMDASRFVCTYIGSQCGWVRKMIDMWPRILMSTAVNLGFNRGLLLPGVVPRAFPAWAIVAIVLGSVLILVVGALAAQFATYRQRSNARAAGTAGERHMLLSVKGVRTQDAQKFESEPVQCAA